MRLVKGMRPSCRSIADFRRNHAVQLRKVNRDFVLLCRELSLFGGDEAAVDGSFFSAAASRASIRIRGYIDRELEKIEKLKKRRKEKRETKDCTERSGDTQVSTADEDARLLRKRGRTVERLLGTLKVGNSFHQFLMRGLEKCRGEFNLMTLTYNFSRVLNIRG